MEPLEVSQSFFVKNYGIQLTKSRLFIHANYVNEFNITRFYRYHRLINQDVESLYVSLSVSHSLELLFGRLIQCMIFVPITRSILLGPHMIVTACCPASTILGAYNGLQSFLFLITSHIDNHTEPKVDNYMKTKNSFSAPIRNSVCYYVHQSAV